MKHPPAIILLLIGGLFVSCKQSPLCVRTGADYFPLKTGNTATYSITPKNKIINVKIAEMKTIGDRESFILERNGKPEYWYKSTNSVDKLFLYTLNIEGKEDTLARWWMPWLELPLSKNNTWAHTFNTSKVILGDTIKIRLQTNAEVIDLNGDEYTIRTDFTEEKRSEKLGSYLINKTCYEYYKPNLGLTKRTFNDTTETLIEFITGNDTLLKIEDNSD